MKMSEKQTKLYEHDQPNYNNGFIFFYFLSSFIFRHHRHLCSPTSHPVHGSLFPTHQVKFGVLEMPSSLLIAVKMFECIHCGNVFASCAVLWWTSEADRRCQRIRRTFIHKMDGKLNEREFEMKQTRKYLRYSILVHLLCTYHEWVTTQEENTCNI